MNDFLLLDQLIIKMVALLGASLLVERILAFISQAINRLFLFQYSNRNSQVDKLKEHLSRDAKAREEDQVLREETEDDDGPDEISFHPNIPKEKRKFSSFDVLTIRPLKKILKDEDRYQQYKENNRIRKDFWMQIFGTLIAIIACGILDFSIWEFFVYSVTGSFPESHGMFDYLFTGIIIGSGSKPIHFLMSFVVNRKIEIDRSEIREEAKSVPEMEPEPTEKMVGGEASVFPATMDTQALSIEERVGFEYDGGDRPGRLEHTHLYNQPIDLIVYHHTAMHSEAPFSELVKEFDRKGWLTGYHCVVFYDGTIRVLCRWDRFGNHAKPYNCHSFGIAFQGNFETNPNIPFSNPEGKLGIREPKPPQLKAAARVVAMYALMHDISLDFHDSFADNAPVQNIIPHRAIANKACPGSNFPNPEFQGLVESFHNKWKNDPAFDKTLDRFRKKSMVIPKT